MASSNQGNNKKVRHLIEVILSEDGLSSVAQEINKLHPSEIADLLEATPENQREPVWHLVRTSLKGEVLLEVRGEIKEKLINWTAKDELIAAVSRLQLDEIIDLEKHLPVEVIRAIVARMDEYQRKRYHQIRQYPSDTAGGLMDVDIMQIDADVKLAVVLRYLRYYRKKMGKLPEHLSSISVIDNNKCYLGELPLSDVASLPANALVQDVMNKEHKAIKVDTPAKHVSAIFEDHDLISAPVVDQDKHLLGRITVDDVVNYMRKSTEHMILSPVGLSERSDLFSSIATSIKSRLFWLGLNLVNAFAAAMVISLFSSSIEKIVILAVLMPVVASMSGVVGNQTLTLVTRGIALSQITRENSIQLLFKEASVGFLNGLIWAVFVGGVSYFWFHNLYVSLIFSLAMLLSILLAAVGGTLIPIILSRLKLDPAIAGSVLIVAISDIMGFFLFLGIATLFLL